MFIINNFSFLIIYGNFMYQLYYFGTINDIPRILFCNIWGYLFYTRWPKIFCNFSCLLLLLLSNSLAYFLSTLVSHYWQDELVVFYSTLFHIQFWKQGWLYQGIKCKKKLWYLLSSRSIVLDYSSLAYVLTIIFNVIVFD